MVIGATSAFAGCDYVDRCTATPYDLSSKGCQLFSNLTGSTFLVEQVAQSVIRGELKKETKEKFKVKLKSYSAFDLAHGRFKSLSISGKNLDIDGVYITSLDLNTLCPFNYVELSKKSIKFKENMVVGFKTEISDTDLRKTMKSGGYLDKLNKVNLSGLGITLFKLEGADVRIKNNKIYFTINVSSQLFSMKKSSDIVICSDVKVEDGRIVLTKIEFVNLFARLDLSKITYLLNAINPLTFSMNILENENTKLSVQNVNIIGDRIVVDGTVFIPKNTYKAK